MFPEIMEAAILKTCWTMGPASESFIRASPPRVEEIVSDGNGNGNHEGSQIR